MPPAQQPGRSAQKRASILEAATVRFLGDGYGGTSMDQIAADAAVSKQTVYQHFATKEQLFRAIVGEVTGNARAVVGGLAPAGATADSLGDALSGFARRYLDGVLQPHVLALRRLVIAEAERFPDLARAYYDQAVSRGIDAVADALRGYERQGLLDLGDARVAAAQFAYLVLGVPLDRAHFLPRGRMTRAQRDQQASQAVRVFLAAYATGAPRTTP